MFLEEKEQEMFGKTYHGVSQSKRENELRESACHSAWHFEGTLQTDWVLRVWEGGRDEIHFMPNP